MQAWALLFIATATSAAYNDPECTSDPSSSLSPRARLHSDLLCEYDTETHPQKVMNISMDMYIRSATVVHRTLNMRVLLHLWWHDPFLAWDPARYDGLTVLELHSDEIWTPDLATISTLPWVREGGGMQKEIWPSVCSVTSDGTVKCSSAPDLGGTCFVSYFFWPHVQAKCASYLGSDFRTVRNVMLSFHNSSLSQTELSNYYVPGNDWVITSCDRDSFNEGEILALIYKVTLHSRGAVISTGLIGPAVVLSLVLLGTFFLPPSSYTRLGLCCCSNFGTVLASSLFFNLLPEYDGPDPVVATFYSGLLLLSAVATIMTLVLNIVIPLKRKPPVAPRWLYSFQSWLARSSTGKIWLKILLMTPLLTNICHQIELMPTLHMQTDSSADLDNRQENQDHLHQSVTSQLNEKAASPDFGPHKIWDFFVSFTNRCMFLIYLISCFTLCLHLGYSVAVYEDFNVENLG